MKAWVLLDSLVAFILLTVGCGSPPAPGKPDPLVLRLRDIEVKYTNDGAGGCLPELMDDPAVKAVLDTPDGFLQVIRHLDSPELTSATFEGRRVPLGYLCLDILLKSVDKAHRPRVLMDYGDDGLWSNAVGTYYYPPDVLQGANGQSGMRGVRGAWEQLYDESKGTLFGPSSRGAVERPHSDSVE